MADPHPQLDHHHFDNPVYAFQQPNAINDSSAVANDLRLHKPISFDRAKLGYSDSSSNSSRGTL